MSKLARYHTCLATGAILLAWLLGPSLATAQEPALLTGLVADESTWTPVASALVTLVGTGLETESEENGTFTFSDPPLGPVSVRVDAPGFASMVHEVVVRRGAVVYVQFVLPTVTAFLEELLVVGQRTERTSALAEARTAADLLAGRIAGFNRDSGIVGADRSRVFTRGVRTFTLGGEPDVYLDGIRMAGGFGEALQLLRQIPASDVKEIEVLRGPAAAFLQGSAHGAIQVRTRSGSNE